MLGSWHWFQGKFTGNHGFYHQIWWAALGLSGENCPIILWHYDSWHWLYQKQVSSNDMKPVWWIMINPPLQKPSSGWWCNNYLEKYEFVNGVGMTSQYIMENKTCLKPPTSYPCLWGPLFLAKSLAALLTGGGHRPRTSGASQRRSRNERHGHCHGSRSKRAANKYIQIASNSLIAFKNVCQLLAKNKKMWIRLNQKFLHKEMNPLTSHSPVVSVSASRSNATEGWDEDPPRDHTPGTCSVRHPCGNAFGTPWELTE